MQEHDSAGAQAQVVTATREIAASAKRIFELIADPSQQPRWDGNDNLGEAPAGQRVHGVGEVFVMVLGSGSVRDNHVVEFEEGRRIAWRPADQGRPPAGHLWRWELEPTGPSSTRVTHTYDWSQLTDEKRFARARSTTPEMLRASLDRLADLACSVSAREDFVRRLFDRAWSHGDTAMVVEGVGDVVFHYGRDGRTTDGRALADLIDRWRRGFPDLRFAVEDLVEGSDLVAVRARLQGTHLGPWRDVPATGRQIDVAVMMFFRWEDDRLVEIWEVDDAQARDRQLGLA